MFFWYVFLVCFLFFWFVFVFCLFSFVVVCFGYFWLLLVVLFVAQVEIVGVRLFHLFCFVSLYF